MNRATTTAWTAVLGAVLAAGTMAAAAADSTPVSKPNIVLINIDDLGYADIGPFGSTNATPQLDRMAKEGMKLASHYAAPVCSPSRAAMMTGCYPKRVLPIPGVLFPVSAVGVSPDETTVAEVLKARGYATAIIGKWHLGDQPPFLPTAQGFDSYLGIPYSNDMGPASEGSKSNPGQPLPGGARAGKQAVGVSEADGTGVRGAQPPLPMLDGGNVIERVKAEQQHLFTRRYTERAVAFIRERREGPFFLYFAHNAVHFPHYPHRDYMGEPGGNRLHDWIREVDWSVGQVLGALRELKIDGNTLVVFTSDNGGPVNQGACNAPLRGGKGSTFEGGMRVCTIAWWPGRVAAGSVTKEITSHMDWLPTFAALAGGAPVGGRKIDGIDLSPMLLGQTAAFKPREAFYYFQGFNLQAVRSGAWKLQLDKGQLYNLEDDIGEARDVAGAHADQVARLRALAAAMEPDLGLTGKDAPGVRALGRVEHPEPFISADGKVRAGFDGVAKELP